MMPHLKEIVPEIRIQQDPRCRIFVSDPYSRYTRWHRHACPVYWQEYGFWCLLSYDGVNSVLRDRRFARLPPSGSTIAPVKAHLRDFAAAEKFSLLAMEPPAHTRLRKLVNRAFVSRHINTIAPLITAMAHSCMDSFQKKRSIELLEHFATPIPLNAITRLLGVPESSGKQLIEWSHAMVRVYTLTLTHEEEIIANKAAAEFQEFLRTLLDTKRSSPGDDLLSHMLSIRDEGNKLSDDEIISVTILLLNAGHEATVHQLGNAVYTLLEHYPTERRADLLNALADDKTADSIVNECLRYAAPLHLFTRYAQEDVMLEGAIKLTRGDQVGLLLAAANRCPKKFLQPDSFIPDRADAAHLSLGAGIHFCIGAQLARIELRIALQVLFSRLPTLQLEQVPHHQDAYHFHGLQALHVSW